MKNSLFQQQANSVTSTAEIKSTEEKMFSIFEHLAQLDTRDDTETPRVNNTSRTEEQINNTAQLNLEKLFNGKFEKLERVLFDKNVLALLTMITITVTRKGNKIKDQGEDRTPKSTVGHI